MSYILDALKRAETQRERDASAVPDLYAQADAARGARAAARLPGWMRLGLAAAIVALAVLAWRWFSAAPVDATPPVFAVTAPAAMPAPVPVPAPVAAALPPHIAAAPAPPTASAAPPRARAAPRPAVVAAARPAPPASAPSAARLYALAELPPDIRSQLPALAVGGSVYSPNAASRIVILNGQVFREGDKPIDGLSVEQIRLKSTVLAFRGVRFELKH